MKILLSINRSPEGHLHGEATFTDGGPYQTPSALRVLVGVAERALQSDGGHGSFELRQFDSGGSCGYPSARFFAQSHASPRKLAQLFADAAEPFGWTVTYHG